MRCKAHEEMSGMHPEGYYSGCLDKAIKYAESQGYVVEMGTLPGTVMGRIYYGTGDEDGDFKKIVIDAPCAGCALMALLHEIGHMEIRGQKIPILNRSSSESANQLACMIDNEILADLVGMTVGMEIGFELDDEWKEFGSRIHWQENSYGKLCREISQ